MLQVAGKKTVAIKYKGVCVSGWVGGGGGGDGE